MFSSARFGVSGDKSLKKRLGGNMGTVCSFMPYDVHLCPMWRKQRGIRKAQYRYIRDICPSVAVCMYIFRNMFFHSRVYVWHLLYFALPFQRRLALWTQMRWQCLCKVHRISSKKKGWKPLACSMIMAHGFATNTTAPFLFSQYCMENNNCRVCGAFVTKASIS